MDEITDQSSKARLGIVGLDDILLGGLRRNRLVLIEGSPGAGKTTLALQFSRSVARSDIGGQQGLLDPDLVSNLGRGLSLMRLKSKSPAGGWMRGSRLRRAMDGPIGRRSTCS
jgi:MoxR-like ATPase